MSISTSFEKYDCLKGSSLHFSKRGRDIKHPPYSYFYLLFFCCSYFSFSLTLFNILKAQEKWDAKEKAIREEERALEEIEAQERKKKEASDSQIKQSLDHKVCIAY